MSEKTESNSNGPGMHEIDHHTADRYQEIKTAEEYDRIRFNSIAGKVFDRLEKAAVRRALATVEPGSTIVDCPVGTGRHAEPLLDLGYSVEGVDLSSAMLDVAQKKLQRFGDRFTGRVANAESFLNDPSGQFEAGICMRLLMHLPLEEQIGVLKGISHISKGPVVFNHSLTNRYFQIRRKVKRLLGHQVPTAHPVTRAQLAELVTKAGLRIARIYWVLPLVSEAIVVRAMRI